MQAAEAAQLVPLMEAFQDELVSMDSFGVLRRQPDFGSSYIRRMVKRVNDHSGVVLVAEVDGEIVGWTAGILQKQTDDDLLEYFPYKKARIIELYVSNESRGKGIGKDLMSTIEKHFRSMGCDRIELGVDSFNRKAHEFYVQFGFKDRNTDMWKSL